MGDIQGNIHADEVNTIQLSDIGIVFRTLSLGNILFYILFFLIFLT